MSHTPQAYGPVRMWARYGLRDGGTDGDDVASVKELGGDLVEAVTALEEEPGEGVVGPSGSVSVVRQLPTAGLLDELHLSVHPIAVRKGVALFDEGGGPSR